MNTFIKRNERKLRVKGNAVRNDKIYQKHHSQNQYIDTEVAIDIMDEVNKGNDCERVIDLHCQNKKYSSKLAELMIKNIEYLFD